MAGILQTKKAIYPLDMEGFWLRDNYRIIAAGGDYSIKGHKDYKAMQRKEARGLKIRTSGMALPFAFGSHC
jgi:hypothetical protein